MSSKKIVEKTPAKKKKVKKEPRPGTWEAIVKGAAYAKKAGLQNWPG